MMNRAEDVSRLRDCKNSEKVLNRRNMKKTFVKKLDSWIFMCIFVG